MVRHASLWTLWAVDGVVGMLTKFDGVGWLAKKDDDDYFELKHRLIRRKHLMIELISMRSIFYSDEYS